MCCVETAVGFVPGLAVQSAGSSISLRPDRFSPDSQLFHLIGFPSNSPEEISSTSACDSIPKCVLQCGVKCDDCVLDNYKSSENLKE